MEWVNIKDRIPDPVKESGHYVVLIGGKPHIVYFGQRNWNTPWHIPIEWKEPTHYIRLEDTLDKVFTSIIYNGPTMD
jgi:pyoverdine/dityrosine biosynthesis protein Dit1